MGQFTRQRWFDRFRGTARAALIEDDLPCSQCGYNLRGLMTGGRCPECGLLIPRDPTGRVATDPAALRSRLATPGVRWGLLLSAAGLFVITPITFLRLFLLVGDDALAWFRTGCALMWGAGALMFLRKGMDVVLPKLSWPRRAISVTQAGWIVGYILLWLRVVVGVELPVLLEQLETMLGFVAGVGAIVMAWYLKQVAEELEAPEAATRLNVALWGLPILSIILMGFPDTLTILSQVLMGLFLAPWCIVAWTYAMGLRSLSQSLTWTRQGDRRLVGRDDRVAATREEMDREVSAKVRSAKPAPAPWEDDPDGDLPLA